MQQHAIALGYFFLAVFCVLSSAHCLVAFQIPLIVAALVALVVGVGYVAGPAIAGLSVVQAEVVQLIRLAQQTPTHKSATAGEKQI